ncbi:MAG: ribosome silencing factor [Acidobacteriota bacterium]
MSATATTTVDEPTDDAHPEAALADAERRPRTRAGTLESIEQARLAAEAALDRQAVDLKVLELAGVSDFTDYFLICTGNNERQVQAIADAIEKSLRDAKVKPLHIEGKSGARWVLLDYGGDMVVHVFRDEARSFYDLERLWSDAPDVTDQLVEGAAG